MVVAGHRGLATGLAGLEKALAGLGRRKRGEEGARAAEQEARSKLSDNYELIAKVKIYLEDLLFRVTVSNIN